MDAVKDTIRQFILTHYLPGEIPDNVGDDLRLVTSGILDSLATLGLAGFLEREYGVELSATEIGVESFDRIEDMASLVVRKRAA